MGSPARRTRPAPHRARPRCNASARAGNVYFDANAPWKSIKTDPAECHRLIYVCLCRAAAIGLMLRPFLPKSADAILKNFSLANAFAAGSATLRAEDVVQYR